MTFPELHHFLPYLPPVERFVRPLWAYDFLPQGWDLLKRLALGNTDMLLAELARLDSEVITPPQLDRLMSMYAEENWVRVFLMSYAAGQSAAVVRERLITWQNALFALYLDRAKKKDCGGIDRHELTHPCRVA